MGKMNPEYKVKWIDELRSGRFEQASSFLRRIDESRCCLGVLQNLVDDTIWKLSKDDIESEGKAYYYCDAIAKQNCYGMLPRSTLTKTGLSPKAQEKLIGFNDSGMNFNEIADWIEENL
jgi:hypothetical protein